MGRKETCSCTFEGRKDKTLRRVFLPCSQQYVSVKEKYRIMLGFRGVTPARQREMPQSNLEDINGGLVPGDKTWVEGE